MIKSLTIFTVLISIASFGQSELIMPNKGKTLEKIIPHNWKLLDSTTGDLNKDGISDLVFAIQKTTKENIKLNEGLGTDTIDLNPRILAIYFGTESGAFRKKLVSEDFIILRDSPTMDEPLEGFSINKKGILDINFRFWYSAGSWSMSNHKYRFRFQNNDFALIGYESNEAHRASGETTDYSIDFLTKKMKITKGNFSNNNTESVEWKEFDLEKLLTVKSIKKPFELEFHGIYL
ncbi:hypothetical protein [Winogradskyella sp. SYSU M77433]|uniref:hypothetical protein n=1 Tax=Winogradskyella sp. SYSU M77433 TaxID=3042722 RepID=UPI0024802269|nr:hypothetical protein [Winogradskyella sp. SYSU M77433]MDH7913104.1 hypothetical protein [Winogradskyella sp. SYSU M77433]